MLSSVTIEAFQRINFMQVDLKESAVHVFCGANEAGKSSMAEAIRFAIRGASNRVERKGAFGELISNGKKSGNVEIELDGFLVRRNIRDGKVTTRAPLDYPPLLVDIQLGAIEFAQAPEKELRTVLNQVFNIGSSDEFLRSRLRHRKVSNDIMDRTLPLVRAGSFEAASKEAHETALRLRGKWEATTHEKYGSVKAKDWRPEILSAESPTDAAIAQARSQVERLTSERDSLNRRLGALSAALKAQEGRSDLKIEDLEAAELAARTALAELTEQVDALQVGLQDAIKAKQAEIADLERRQIEAKQATATLECPSCGAALHVKTTENTPLLVRATPVAKKDGPSLAMLTASLSEARAAINTIRAEYNGKIEPLHRQCAEAQTIHFRAESTLRAAREALAAPVVTQEEADMVAADIAKYDEDLASATAACQALYESRRAWADAQAAVALAASIHGEIVQWEIVSEALGAGPEGIPAELLAMTVKPLNTTLAQLAATLDTSPCMMGSNMTITRADGMPYHLLSESAKWRANAMVQLALATLSPLKLVILDRFDVLDPASRGAFIDMLKDYTKRVSNVTVLAFGTLKKVPQDEEGVRFHWIQDGQLIDAAA